MAVVSPNTTRDPGVAPLGLGKKQLHVALSRPHGEALMWLWRAIANRHDLEGRPMALFPKTQSTLQILLGYPMPRLQILWLGRWLHSYGFKFFTGRRSKLINLWRGIRTWSWVSFRTLGS